MDADTPDLDAAAARHGLSRSAAEALYAAMVRGGGRQAQFSHPDLGGMGQWSGGGMVQVGDMFNDALKAKVSGFCTAMAEAASQAGSVRSQAATDAPLRSEGSGGGWWPDDLGAPASRGDQNGMRYACFPEKRRLVIERDGRVTVYDTGDHRLTGFAQQGGGGGTPLSFSGPDGPVALDDLRAVER